MESSTAEIWLDRIERWRASGERAELFSRREGYAASTLRWWASKLRHELCTGRKIGSRAWARASIAGR